MEYRPLTVPPPISLHDPLHDDNADPHPALPLPAPRGPTIIQALEAFGLNLREMHEDILTAVVRSDEAESLLVVEELNGTGLRHGWRWEVVVAGELHKCRMDLVMSIIERADEMLSDFLVSLRFSPMIRRSLLELLQFFPFRFSSMIRRS